MRSKTIVISCLPFAASLNVVSAVKVTSDSTYRIIRSRKKTERQRKVGASNIASLRLDRRAFDDEDRSHEIIVASTYQEGANFPHNPEYENDRQRRYYYREFLLWQKLLGVENPDKVESSSFASASSDASVSTRWHYMLIKGASNALSAAFSLSVLLLEGASNALLAASSAVPISKNARESVRTGHDTDWHWKLVAGLSAGLLVAFPITLFVSSIVSSIGGVEPVLAILCTTTGVDYLNPTTYGGVITPVANAIHKAISFFVGQASVYIRATSKIKPIPLMLKFLKKCAILEIWRHIWVRIYKATQWLYTGMLGNIAKLYTRYCPAMIRRGLKLRYVFQSLVQNHAHGAMGAILGSVGFTTILESYFNPYALPSFIGQNDFTKLTIESTGAAGDATIVEIANNNVDTAVQSATKSSINIETTIEVSVVDSAHSIVVEAAAAENILDAAIEAKLQESNGDVIETVIDTAVDSLAIGTVMEITERAADTAIESAVKVSLESVSDSSIVEVAIESVAESTANSVIETTIMESVQESGIKCN